MQSSLLTVALCALTLTGCAGMNGEFGCNVKAEDRCMTMEEANTMAATAGGRVQHSPVTQSAAPSVLPRLAPVPVIPSPVTGIQAASRDAGVRSSVTSSHLLSSHGRRASSSVSPAAARPAPSYTTPAPTLPTASTAARAYADIGVTQPVRVNPTTARLWIAGWVDSDDVLHQPAVVSFVAAPDQWAGS